MAGRMNEDYHVSLPDYCAEKIRMLEDDFCIDLTYEEIEHFESLQTEADIDAYAHDILVERL